MAPWDLFTKPAPDPAFPDTLAGSHTGADTAFEVFVDGALTRIYNEASGRAREQKQIREACKKVLGELLKCIASLSCFGRACCTTLDRSAMCAVSPSLAPAQSLKFVAVPALHLVRQTAEPRSTTCSGVPLGLLVHLLLHIRAVPTSAQQAAPSPLARIARQARVLLTKSSWPCTVYR